MTYRIAHVRFERGEQAYPVNCHRSDLQPGDFVFVEMPKQQRLKLAEVDRVEHLNWNCANTIVCRQSELRTNADGTWSVERDSPVGDRLETLEDLATAIGRLGWSRYRPTSNVWRTVFAKPMAHAGAIIAARKNGIDFQVCEPGRDIGISGRSIMISQMNGRLVRHSYYASEVDLIEMAFAFARAVDQPGADLEGFFRPVGKRQPRLARRGRDDGGDELWQIREAINGGDGPAYLCDGVWI